MTNRLGPSESPEDNFVFDIAAPFQDSGDTELARPPFGLTGDWLGKRDFLLDAGVDFRTNVTQFYQGIPTGGLQQDFDYGLKLDYFGTIKTEKLFGWNGGFINLHGESRFGESINRRTGAVLPSNFALEFPQATGDATALTNVQFEQFFGENFAVTFGKLNTADGVNIHPFLGGNGVDRFQNEAFVINPIYDRTIPYSALGAGFSYLREHDPLFTFLLFDSSGEPGTSGFGDLFSNGASFFAHLSLPVMAFGLPGHQSFEGAYATGSFSPLSANDYVILDVPNIPAKQHSGSWALTYGFDQFLFVDPKNPRRGFGLFGTLSYADEQTSPLRFFAILGLGGASPLPRRDADSLGAACYFVDISSELRDIMEPSTSLNNEQGLEFYYNARVTNSFVLTADIQVVEPAQSNVPTAFVLGVRAKIAL